MSLRCTHAVGARAARGHRQPFDAAYGGDRGASARRERQPAGDVVTPGPSAASPQQGPGRRASAHDDGPVRRVRPGNLQRGYSLLEVIVAFGVLGVALSLLLGTLSGGTRQVRWAADSGRAVLHAQSLLDEVGVGEVLAPGRRDGEFEQGRFRWELDVAPYVDRDRPPVQPADPFAPQLLQLRLRVSWGDGGPRERLQLETLRLVQPDPSGLSG